VRGDREMKFEDIFITEPVVLEETRIYEQKAATDFDKETKHVHRIAYDPKAFRSAFKDIIEDDVKFKTAASKIKAIKDQHPFWKEHLDKIIKVIR
jgi:hypothetical protein